MDAKTFIALASSTLIGGALISKKPSKEAIDKVRVEIEKQIPQSKKPTSYNPAGGETVDETKSLQLALEESERKFARAEKIINQLQTSFHTPEKWASYKGKQDVLKNLAELYQEAFLARGSGVDVQVVANWVLIRLENIFQTHGMSKFGKVDSSGTFDPSHHQFIPGFETGGEEIVIKCPGLEIRDPAGNQVVLARAKIVKP